MKKRATSSGVQMFSFLDAMVCTLGALLVLLHAFARHGQIDRVRKAEAKAAQNAPDDTQAELEILQWRAEQLKLVRDKTESQLADERLKLSHVEDHERRLHERVRKIQIELAELERLTESGSAQRQQQLAALEAAQAGLEPARKAAEDARRKKSKQAAYSVVPYEGANPTHRRPIYIECRAGQMILQPEGVELSPADFAGYLGPGNPLASALRGTREYYARQAGPRAEGSEPYPLLLVRPDGVKTYYAARAALESWGSDFGYEMVGADWQLEFSEPDQRLTQLLRQIVADSRLRMRELMIVTSQLAGHRPRTTLRASSSGGFVADRAPHGDARGGSRRSSAGGWDSLDSEWAGGGAGDGEGGEEGTLGGTGSTGAGSSGTGLSGGAGAGGRAAGDAATGRSGGSTARGSGVGDAPGSDRIAQNQGRIGGGTGADYPGPSDGDRSTAPSGRYGTSRSQAAADASARQTDPAVGQSSETSGSHSPGATTGQSSGALASGGTSGSTSASSGGGSASAGDSAASSSSMTGQSHSSIVEHTPRKTASLAKSRGRDWGLPDGGLGMAPATRPILVECHNDRLVIVPEDRGAEPAVTRLGVEARENIDQFVADVWRHMKSWGIAGRGLYWRPTLVMSVEPGAADRYAEIKGLLADSGLDVRERPPRAAESSPRTNSTRR